MSESAKTRSQKLKNQSDDFFSGQHLVLASAYHYVYEILRGMLYGGSGIATRPELLRALERIGRKASPGHDDAVLPPLPESCSSVFEDYLNLQKLTAARVTSATAEVEFFQALVRSSAARTVRKIANQSRWLCESGLGLLLREQPDVFLKAKASPRFPRSSERQADFLARALAAAMAGYEPSTGQTYVAGLVRWCGNCGRNPVIVDRIANRMNPIINTGSVGGEPINHTEKQCPYSSWPCPTHHPNYPANSGVGWCGVC